MVGSTPDAAVHKHFSYTIVDNAKLLIAKCLRCKNQEYAKNTNRQRKHLDECKSYQDWKRQNNPINPFLQQKTLLHTLRIEPGKKARIDKKLAFAIYKTGRPFSMVEDEAQLDFFQELSYTSLATNKLSRQLLNKVYSNVAT